jgi:hypothetical protein
MAHLARGPDPDRVREAPMRDFGRSNSPSAEVR